MMFGSEGIQSRIVYLDDKYLQTTGGGREAMAAALDQLDSGKDNGLDSHREGLPARGNLIFLGDIASTIVRSLSLAAAIPNLPFPLDRDALEQLDLENSYISFVASSESDGLRFQTHVPVEQIRSAFDIGMMFQSMRNQ